ncbi:MAG: outer membrane beta-barrel protein [Bacteroidota bacterium]
MKKQIFVIFIVSSFVFCSCSVTTSLQSTEKSMARQAESNGNSMVVVNKPLVADVSVSLTRQTLSYSTTNLEINNSTTEMSASRSSLSQENGLNVLKNEAKKRAQFQFMKDFECDFLVDPIYTVNVQSQSNSEIINFQIELTAFPAKYTKFTQPDSLPKSVMQISAVDTRSLPLYIATRKNEKTQAPSESGAIMGLGISKTLQPVSTDKFGMSWNLGLYKSYGVTKPVGFRGEFKISGFGGKSIYFQEEVKEVFTSASLPLMLSINLKKINILAGLVPSINLIGKANSETAPYLNQKYNSEFYNGLTLGLSYKVTEKMAVGYRFEKLAIGSDYANGYANHGLNIAIRFK